MINAALGCKEDAIREGGRAVELLPVTKDALAGTQVLTNLALTYAWQAKQIYRLDNWKNLYGFPARSLMANCVCIRSGILCAATRVLGNSYRS